MVDVGHKLYEELLKEVEAKNSWGKNELKTLIQETWIRIMQNQIAEYEKNLT